MSKSVVIGVSQSKTRRKLINKDPVEFHRRLRAKARRIAGAVKDPHLRDIAYHSILRHFYELLQKRKVIP